MLKNALRKVTLKKYFLVSTALIIISLLISIHLKRSCAWDGCFPAVHPTFGDALFDLPPIVFQVELLIGIIIWFLRVKK